MNSRRPGFRPPAPPRPHRHEPVVYLRRRILMIAGILTVVIVGYYGITLGAALTNPSLGANTSARAAEWGRESGLGFMVTWAENLAYKISPPKVGGQPTSSQFGSGATAVKVPAGGHLPTPINIVSPAANPLPGEGVWHVAGRKTASGIPTMYEAFVRPDAVHTSYVVGAVWMDPTLLKAQLYSGSQIPGGGPYKFTAPVKPADSKNLVASFNAGFRMKDAKGGYYTQGKTVIPLVKGAASAVIFKDGTMTVGKWGRDVYTNHQIASVRQNLVLIVDNGKSVPGINSNNASTWGATIHNAYAVWRSGVGVTRNGAILYVGGPSMSIADLANVMVRAGAYRAMEMDINTDWVTFSSFTGPLNKVTTGANGKSLLPAMTEGPSHIFASWWQRDFFTMNLRSNQTATKAKR